MSEDKILRAITNDNAFRVIVLEATRTAQATVAAQAVTGSTASALAELIVGTVLVRETLAPTLRVQGIAKGAEGRGSLVADSHPDGTTRGLAQIPEGVDGIELGEGSLLQMMRSFPNGAIQQGVVRAPAGKGLNGALMQYLQESEQVVSVLDVHAEVHGGVVVRAGGYMVQLLPEAERPAHMIMTERLDDFPPAKQLVIKEDFTPAHLLDEILLGMPYTVVSESSTRFACNCSVERLLTALASLSKPELTELAESDEALEISCDYCGKQYAIAPSKLKTLLTSS